MFGNQLRRFFNKSSIFLVGSILICSAPTSRAQYEEAGYDDATVQAMDPETQEIEKAKEAIRSMEGYLDEASYTTPRKKKKSKSYTKAEAFVAGPNWEFDGFVAGGQDSHVKSMFVLNDILYLNIGFSDGLESGDVLSIYRRGDRIRDPQTGRFIGYEVRRAAISQVTNKVDEDTCAVRITQTYEGVEIGDLVRID